MKSNRQRRIQEFVLEGALLLGALESWTQAESEWPL